METGRVIPTIIGSIAGLICATGILPLRWFGFQDFQIARQVLQPDAPFRPNLHLWTDNFVGGEAEAGNLTPTERLPPRRFTTDALGFRASIPVRPGHPPSVIVFRGFSFVFGVGLSDEQTFPAELGRNLGVNVYNGARFHDDPETPADYDRLTRRIGNPRIAVYVHLEPNGHVLSWYRDSASDRAGKALFGPETYDNWVRATRFARERVLTWMRVSPMIQMAVTAKKALENDRFLANRYRANVRAFSLPDHSRMLVRTGDLSRAQTNFDDELVRERADYIEWWRNQLARRGTEMVVLLVPDKISVYGPKLGVRLPSDPYLARLERELTARRIRVVNGLALLRAHAAEDLATGRLAYLREDEHWNALGVRRLAQATAQVLKSEASLALAARR